MKKTILFFLSLMAIVPFSPAQSDATLEETIEWLNTFGLNGNAPKSQCIKIGNIGLLPKSPGYFSGPTYNIKIPDNLGGAIYFRQNGEILECNGPYSNDYIMNSNVYKMYTGEACDDGPECYFRYHVFSSELAGWGVKKTPANFYLSFRDKHGNVVTYSFSGSDSEKVDRVINAIKHLFKLQYINIPFEDKRSLENKF